MYREIVTDIFFDLDHTLWDFEKNSALTYAKIFKENKLNIDLDAFLVTYIPVNHEHWKLYREEKITKEALRFSRLHTTFTKMDISVPDAVINKLSEEYIQYLSSFTHLFAGATEILTYLQPKYNLHIITNGFNEVQRFKLENSKIHQFFSTVVDSEMVGVKKPNPLIFEYSLQSAKTSAETSIMIGDSLEADILGAKNAGMHTIHFNSNKEAEMPEGITIYNLLDLKKYL